MATDVDAKALVSVPGISPYSKAIRKIYASAMQSSGLKKATPEILRLIDVVINLIEEARKEGQVELSSLFQRLTLDAIGALALEINMGGLDNSREIYQLFEKVKHLTMARITNPLLNLYCKWLPWSKAVKERTSSAKALQEEYAELIRIFQQRDNPVEGEEPMWYALKTMTDPESGKPITFQTMVAEVGLMVFGGMDSTGGQLWVVMMLLASYPKVTEKLLQELRENSLYGPGSHEVTFDDLSNLAYLTAIIKESLRLASAANGIADRLTHEDMAIDGYRIPKGTRILFPMPKAVNTVEDWGDPDVFRPERWLTGEEMSTKYYLPFSTGPRDCVGQKLAMLEMRLVIVKLLTRYEFAIEGNWRSIFENAKDGIVIEPEKGVWFKVTPRTMHQ